MNAEEMVKTALAIAEKTQRQLAQHMGWSPQNLSARLKNGSLSFDEVCKALRFCGYDVKPVDTNGNALPRIGNSSSRRVSQTVNGEEYDTAKAESIGVGPAEENGMYMELFRKASGEFFLVSYSKEEAGHDRITPVTKAYASILKNSFMVPM